MTGKSIPSLEMIREKIYVIRGQKVMLDQDLAELYGVETKQLKRQVKRNSQRFPDDFLIRLSPDEYELLRCQFGTLKRGGHSKYLPFAFTENGVSMLSSVLKSELAISVNIQIMRTFTKIRELMNMNKDLYKRLSKVEIKQLGQSQEIKQINQVIKEMLNLPITLKRKTKPIGFKR